MRPLVDQARWEAALALSHRLAFRAVVLPDEIEIPVVGGNATLDQTRETRGDCDLELVDNGTLGLTPREAEDLLAPYGNQIRIERGIEYADRSVETVSLGIFRIEDSDAEADPEGGVRIRVAGLDRSAIVIDAVFESAGQIAAGTLFTDAISELLADVYFDPPLETNFAASDLVTPAVLIYEEGDDRWEFVRGLAAAMGGELYFDGDGVLILRSATPGDPVLEIAEGEGGTLVTAARRWTRREAVNRVVVTGENSGESTVRAEAVDDNPLSPTYYDGPFGRKTLPWSSPYVVTAEQAQDAADGLLAKRLGTTQSVSFGAVVNPALEPGDVVTVQREALGVSEDHVLDQLSIPLGVDGVMTGETRAVQVQ